MNQKSVQVSHEWQSLNTLTGAAVGKQIDVQVIHGRDVRLATGDNKPGDEVHGFSFEAGEFFRAETDAKEAWIRSAVYSEVALCECQFDV